MNSKFINVGLQHSAYGDLPFCINIKRDMLCEKEIKSIIKNIEKKIRTSIEYKRWVAFIHMILDQDLCCYHTGESGCNVEIHHYPLTLFEIVELTILNSQTFSTFSIAEEVMSFHYDNLVGFVPLCSTSHQKYHNLLLDIPIEIVEGNYGTLYNSFNIIPDSIAERYFFKVSLTQDTISSKWYMNCKNYFPRLFKDSPSESSEQIIENERERLQKINKDWGDDCNG